MTLFKIPLNNVKRCMRDYAIYFFTLIIGVSIFYVFNAIGGQAAMLEVSSNRSDIVELLQTTLSGVSVFVAIILALLIVYASRFLMKRRNREFALYMLLGMSKGSISAVLLMETIVIGAGSLFVGLFLGVALSQLMSALVVNLFEADMRAFSLTVSGEAISKTVLFFSMMYLAVMIFNDFAVTKMKLIDLIQSGRKSEQIRLNNPVLCIGIFAVSAACLGYAYYRVGWDYGHLNQKNLMLFIAMGAASTFFIFRSVAGLMLKVSMRMKKVYYRGLNAFIFRQISSRVGTMVFSMTVICLMLFVTICTLMSAFSVRNSLNANLKQALSESVEGISKYETLRKIGASEKKISTSLFRQTGIFFLMPLLLAIIHSVFGMKFATQILETFGTDGLWESIAFTSVILVLIYGGYFLITFIESRRISLKSAYNRFKISGQ